MSSLQRLSIRQTTRTAVIGALFLALLVTSFLSASSPPITITSGLESGSVVGEHAGGRSFQISIFPRSLPFNTVGASLNVTFTASGGSGGYTWAISQGTLPAGLTFTAAGVLSGTLTTAGPYDFVVSVTDSANISSSERFIGDIVTSLPIIRVGCDLEPFYVVGDRVSGKSFFAYGGAAPYAFAVTAGAMPPGITMSSTGALSGTFTTPTPWSSFTVTATDSLGATGSGSISVFVDGAIRIIEPTTLPTLTVGTPVSVTFFANAGSSPRIWTVTQGAVPAGLTFTTSFWPVGPGAGLLEGTPTTAGPYDFVVTVTDSSNISGSLRFSGSVLPASVAPIVISPTTLPTLNVGTPVNVTFTASGGTGGFTWAITQGALPAGLTFTAAGVLSGTPTLAGAYTFVVTVTDSASASRSLSLSGGVFPAGSVPITISPTTLPTLNVGTPVSVTFIASGGAGGFSWAITQGALPAGLTFTAAGVLSGTPTLAGAYSFVVTVTDSASISSSAGFSGSVLPAVPTMPMWMLFFLAAVLIGGAASQLMSSRAREK